jgi:hypothetical protein
LSRFEGDLGAVRSNGVKGVAEGDNVCQLGGKNFLIILKTWI